MTAEDPRDDDGRSWIDRGPLALPTGTVDFARTRFRANDGRIEQLTSREAELLAFLARRGNRVVSRDELRVQVFRQHALSMSRAVDATVRRLRVKIEPDPTAPQTLFTAQGYGYRLLTNEAPLTPLASLHPTRPRRLLRLGERVVDLSAGWCEHDEQRVGLTAQERLLLESLGSSRGAAIEAPMLARRVGITGGKQALANAIYRLRAKIEAHAGEPSYLLSVPGVGYRLDAAIEEPTSERDHLARALRSLTDHVGRIVGFDDCVAYVRDGDALIQVAAFGPKLAPDGGVISPLTQQLGEGIVGHAAADGRPLRIVDVELDARYLRDLRAARSELAVPVHLGGRVVGVLDSESTERAAYSDTMSDVFTSLAAIAAPSFAKWQANPGEIP